MGFDTQELVRQAGYEEGDFVPLGTWNSQPSTTSDTATDTYTTLNRVQRFITNTSRYPEGTITYVADYLATASGDQIDVRLLNSTDGEAVTGSELSLTGNTFKKATTGVQEYTPSSTDVPIVIRAQARNQDNTTSVKVAVAQTAIGIQL